MGLVLTVGPPHSQVLPSTSPRQRGAPPPAWKMGNRSQGGESPGLFSGSRRRAYRVGFGQQVWT